MEKRPRRPATAILTIAILVCVASAAGLSQAPAGPIQALKLPISPIETVTFWAEPFPHGYVGGRRYRPQYECVRYQMIEVNGIWQRVRIDGCRNPISSRS